MKRIAAGLLVLAATCGGAQAAPSACDVLRNAVEQAPPGAVFLPSFPQEKDGPLHNTAFLYDNAVATVALAGCGDAKDAARIGDAILVALNHDRYWHDGRLRNGYAAGHADNPVKLAGWWDKKQNRWVEDGYQVGSDSGNMAWAMLALLSLNNAKYRSGAIRIAHWIDTQFDPRPPQGFMGGTFGDQPKPTINRWKSTEHNTDLAAAFAQLATATNDKHWHDRASIASFFVSAMWNGKCGCFDAGMAEDSRARNTALALDAQLWPLLAVPGAREHADAALATVRRRLALRGGLSYGETRDGVWTEGTEQATLVMKFMGRSKEAATLSAAAEKNRAPDGWYFAADTKTSTGFDLQTDLKQHRAYFRIPALAPLAWAALAQRGFNPFTGTNVLPR
ncbi:MAG TPA: hypothetical protein VGH02_02285 [Rhizomicrobium sp.]|jgi:hypothetical protein